jgi:nicotinate phosphoribosyltransferase
VSRRAGAGLEPGAAALFVDLYELTMAASYHQLGLTDRVTFDLYVHNLPPRRNYVVAAGLEPALDYLEDLRFDEAAVVYLRSLGLFDESFLGALAQLRFSGDVWAIPEGELAFPYEPLLRVSAPLVEAQVVETFLLNCVGYQTLIATKAARLSTACAGRPFVDFSPRRDHGTDAAMKAARAATIGGAAGTSLVLAGREFDLELSGTMAHSYVMRFEREEDALLSFARAYPRRAVLLLDTYDTLAGARIVAALAPRLREEGVVPRAVRLDSGDLAELAPAVRRILDDAGLDGVGIFASGDLDEYRIADLVHREAPIDAFGVGTQLGTSGDAPSIGVVYKLVEDPTGPKVKLAPDKLTLPGRKQVYRSSEDGRYSHDVLALADEPGIEGRPLLEPVLRGGRRARPPDGLRAARARCAAALAALPDHLRGLDAAEPAYPVRRSDGLAALCERLRTEHESDAGRIDGRRDG